MGYDDFAKTPMWKHEESVWNKIWASKERWTETELVDSYWYYYKKSLREGGYPLQNDSMKELMKKYPERLHQ